MALKSLNVYLSQTRMVTLVIFSRMLSKLQAIINVPLTMSNQGRVESAAANQAHLDQESSAHAKASFPGLEDGAAGPLNSNFLCRSVSSF